MARLKCWLGRHDWTVHDTAQREMCDGWYCIPLILMAAGVIFSVAGGLGCLFLENYLDSLCWLIGGLITIFSGDRIGDSFLLYEKPADRTCIHCKKHEIRARQYKALVQETEQLRNLKIEAAKEDFDRIYGKKQF